MKQEMPDVEIVRAAHECNNMILSQFSENESKELISVMSVPQELNEFYRQKFEIHKKFLDCAEKIQKYILENAIPTKSPHMIINLPLSLHHFIQARYDENWDIDSRIEIFENLRTCVEKQFEKRKFLQKLQNKCKNNIKYMILVDHDNNLMQVEVHFGKKENPEL